MELVAGVDEAGRGSFLGRVYAGCVIWDDEITHKLLKDSKKLSKNQREVMRYFIEDNCIAYGIGWEDNHYIDKRRNILLVWRDYIRQERNAVNVIGAIARKTLRMEVFYRIRLVARENFLDKDANRKMSHFFNLVKNK